MDFFFKVQLVETNGRKKGSWRFLLLLKSTNDHCFKFYEERIIENSNSHDEDIRLLDEIRRLSHKKKWFIDFEIISAEYYERIVSFTWNLIFSRPFEYIFCNVFM